MGFVRSFSSVLRERIKDLILIRLIFLLTVNQHLFAVTQILFVSKIEILQFSDEENSSLHILKLNHIFHIFGLL